MGVKNFLIEGVSGTGKTTVCHELRRRGYQAINGDRELAYQGDPETGEPTDGVRHENHIWRVDRVKALVADRDEKLTFFCGGSRNSDQFIDLFDEVFVLEVDLDTLNQRLDERSGDEFGHSGEQREIVLQMHRTREGMTSGGTVIDATAPLPSVVDDILARCLR